MKEKYNEYTGCATLMLFGMRYGIYRNRVSKNAMLVSPTGIRNSGLELAKRPIK